MRRKGLWSWIILAIWIVVTCVSLSTMPSMDQLLREKGQPQPGKEYLSRMASDLLQEFHGQKKGSLQIEAIVVYHNPRGLTSSQLKKIKGKLAGLNRKQFHIQSVLSPFTNKKLEERLLSKDRTTLMSIVTLDKGNQMVLELQRSLTHDLKVDHLPTYLTGKDFINEDFIKTSVDSVKSTEVVTIFIIIAVLLLVFRSPITPFISLITVGVSYLVSLCIVLHLVEWFNFPFSNTTQIFLILVLFGIGTDYTILLLMRYKEEVGKGGVIHKALQKTYKTAGKTVLFSALAVFIGFSMVGFSQFPIYQSSVAVAIGILILLLAIFTIVPVCIRGFGKYLFWPVKPTSQGQVSKLWSGLGQLSAKRTMVSLSIILVIALPAILIHRGPLSFNNIKEINPHNNSIEGFRVIAKHFGKGETLPTTIVIQAKGSLDTAKELAWIDSVHQQIQDIPGVSKVYGPTRPLGEPLPQFYLPTQAKQLDSGLLKSNHGLHQVSQGLESASRKIPSTLNGPVSNVGKLVKGTSTIIGSLKQTREALSRIQAGLKKGVDHSTSLVEASKQLEENLIALSTQTNQLYSGYQQLTQTFTSINQEHSLLAGQASAISATADELEDLANALGSDDVSKQLRIKVATLRQQVHTLQAHLAQVDEAFTSTINAMQQANAQLNLISSIMKQMSVGAGKVRQGTQAMAMGLKQGADGQGQVVGGLTKVQHGLHAVNQGQGKMRDALEKFSNQLVPLKHGLQKSSRGIDQISAGLGKANTYLGHLSKDSSASFFVPEEVRERRDFQNMLKPFLSDDHRCVKWIVTLQEDPYSEKAMEVAKRIQNTVQSIKRQNPTVLKVGVGGVSSFNYDLQQISSKDLRHTFLLMILGIGLVLLLFFRSFWTTTATLLSLMISYFSSLAFTKLLFVSGLGYEGISWTVPFFSFIMITALGVDYSIFLLMRFIESNVGKPVDAILHAVKYTGKTVISAMIILSGTFAAMYPSGVNTLMQIATVVIIGLVLLTVLLPLSIPLAIRGREKWQMWIKN